MKYNLRVAIAVLAALWLCTAFTNKKPSTRQTKPGMIRKLDVQIGNWLETGVRNQYGLP